MHIRIAVFLLGAPLWAQNPLSLPDAVQTALTKHPALDAARSGVRMAEMASREAGSGRLPKLNYAESWTRSNNPVLVFSSLLTQHQFTERNFVINTLNRPDAINNFQSQVTIDQVLYDAGQTGHALKSASIGRGMAGEEERGASMNVIAGVVRAYYGAVLAAESLKVAAEAVRSAEADLQRAQTVQAAGMATEADVLSIRVHLAAMRERRIRAAADLDVARAALNEALGLPLGEAHDLTTPLTPVTAENLPLDRYENESQNLRPEARQARLSTSLAENQRATARATLLPQVVFHAGFETDRQRPFTRGGANWLASASLRWNLFNGFGDKARIESSNYALQRAQAQQNQANSRIRLQVRRAHADYLAARQRIEVTEAAVAMAEESLRITRNRYENGLGNVTDLLRTQTALLEAKTRRLAAVYDQRLSAANLELAAGTLSQKSQVLN